MLKFSKHTRERSLSSVTSADSINSNESEFVTEEDVLKAMEEELGLSRHKPIRRSKSFEHTRKFQLNDKFLKYANKDKTRENVTCVAVKNKRFFSTTKRRRKSISSTPSVKKPSPKKVHTTPPNDKCVVKLSTRDFSELYSSPRTIKPHLTELANKVKAASQEEDENSDNDSLSSIEINNNSTNSIKPKEKSWKNKMKLFKTNSFSSSSSRNSKKNSLQSNMSEDFNTLVVNIESLSDNLLIKVFSYLTTDKICKIASVSKKWNALHNDPLLWQRVHLRQNNSSNMDNILNILFKKISTNINYSCLNLNRIHLENTNITDHGLKLISIRCPELHTLYLKNAKSFSSNGVTSILENCPNISRLNFTNCQNLRTVFLPKLPHPKYNKTLWQDLRSVNFIKCPLEVETLSTFIEGISTIESINLSYCSTISDSVVTKLVDCCKRLKYINLNNSCNITDKSVGYIFLNCYNLKSIKLAHNNITDACLTSFNIKLSKSLHHIDLQACRQITDEGIKSLVTICSSISFLNLNGCKLITNESLFGITLLSDLKTLKLKACSNIKDSDIRNMASRDCALRHLDLRMCDISPETCSYVKKQSLNCEILTDEIVFC